VTSISPPTANLILNFDSSKLVRPIQSLQFPINLALSGPANATSIPGCSGQGSGAHATLLFAPSGSYSFTVPPGVAWINVEVIGAGGGGGGGGMVNAGGGGGAGGFARGWINVTPGAVLPIVVGAGGTGGNQGVGNTGGTTQITGLITCTGGQGGQSSSNNCGGGLGGSCVGGPFKVGGATGYDGAPQDPNIPGGAGAGSPYGGGGRTSSGSNVNSNIPGAGGGGTWGPTAQIGNSGADGLVLIEY
jgi:hypothetical protein